MFALNTDLQGTERNSSVQALVGLQITYCGTAAMLEYPRLFAGKPCYPFGTVT